MQLPVLRKVNEDIIPLILPFPSQVFWNWPLAAKLLDIMAQTDQQAEQCDCVGFFFPKHSK